MTAPSNQYGREAAMQLLFLLVALLLIADLHSSAAAVPVKWESNPVVAALEEIVGLPGTLAITKLVDGLSLRLLYAIWKRTGAHAATATVLGTVALHYFPIVFDNYAG